MVREEVDHRDSSARKKENLSGLLYYVLFYFYDFYGVCSSKYSALRDIISIMLVVGY